MTDNATEFLAMVARNRRRLAKLEWSRRARVRRSDLTTQRTYRSTCGRFEVVQVKWHNPDAYGNYWLAIGRVMPHLLISRHRTRQAAERRCNEEACQ